MQSCIVIEGSFKEVNRLALLISLGENNLHYNLFDNIEVKAEDIINAMKVQRTKERAVLVKNVSRETELIELLKFFCNKIPLIITCNIGLTKNAIKTSIRRSLEFQLISIKNIEHEKETSVQGTLHTRL